MGKGLRFLVSKERQIDMKSDKATKNVLDMPGMFKLYEAVKIHRDYLESGKHTRDEVVGFMASKVPFKVTIKNIKTACEGAGIKLVLARPRRPMSGNRPRLAHMNRTKILTIALRRLYRKLGEEVPTALENLFSEVTGDLGDVDEGAAKEAAKVPVITNGKV